MSGWRIVLAGGALLLLTACSNKASENDGNSGDDAVTEAGLYAQAQVAEHENRPHDAIDLYRRILREYPESPQNYKAEFLIGFVFSEELAEPDSARLAFKRVIREYPQSEFVDDAEAMLKFLDGELPAFEESPAP
jgi:outer membrane protein assembly factor BamD (BamD/ComL family)